VSPEKHPQNEPGIQPEEDKMFNDYTLKQLAEARRSDLLREADQERLARLAEAGKGSSPEKPSWVLAMAAGGAALAALVIAFVR
jgi:hypothetical protein